MTTLILSSVHPIVPHLSYDLSVMMITLSTNEVYKVLSTLNPSKSPGPDKVISRLLKDLALELAGPLTCLFNKSLASGQFPDKWKDANLTPVHKSGSQKPCQQFQGYCSAFCCAVTSAREMCVSQNL